MISARKAPSFGSLFLKERLRSHSLVKSLWMLSHTSNGNKFLQSHKSAVACGWSLIYSRSSESDSSIHSYKKNRESAEKVIDDEPDFSIDLQNELEWLSNRVRKNTIQSARDNSETPLTDPQETSTRQPHNDLPLLNHQLSLNVLPQNYRPLKNRVYPVYREQCTRVSSGCRPPPLTTDVAVEVVTCELKSVFGLDRYYAHRIASWLRQPYYSTKSQKHRNQPQLPPALDTGSTATEALVTRTRDTIQALHQLGASPWQLIHMPMLIKFSSTELLSKAPLLVGPGLLSQVSEGLPLLLMPFPSLKSALASLRAESRYLLQHRNRLYFMADVLNVCVGIVCCGIAVAGASKMLNLDLVKLARAMDLFNYYRMDRRYILTHMNVFLIRSSLVEQRYDLVVRATNPPHVLAALHAASLLPAHTLAWPPHTASPVLDDGDTKNTAGQCGYTDAAGGHWNNTGQNGESPAARASALRVKKQRTSGFLLPNAGGKGNCSSEMLQVSSDGLNFEKREANCNVAAAVDDPLTKAAPLVEGEDHLGSHSTALRQTVSNDIITTPAMGYAENCIDNYAMKTHCAIKRNRKSRCPSATDNIRPATACPTATAYSLSAAELEEVLKDYVPPPAHAGQMSNLAFRAMLKVASLRSGFGP